MAKLLKPPRPAPTGAGVKVHFMGIGGSGISGVARMAKEFGYEVSGCDLEENGITYRLRKEGIPVEIGHDASHLQGVDLLAHSPAVLYQSETKPEYVQAKKKKISLIWEEFMAKFLQRDKFVVAVSGTHGKGHTTAMISLILEQAGLDPTCEVGANLINWDKKNYRIGKGKHFVCEADEFRDKFLLYHPNLTVITSIELDHPDYFESLDAVLNSFKDFILQMKDPKILVINGQDVGCLKLLKELKRLKFKGKIILYKKLTKSQAKLKLPGDHMRSDAAAAAAAAKALGVRPNAIKAGLENFKGLERRFEHRGEVDGARLYDDYAHHPTAVEANIKGARELFPKRRIVAVFQPHMHARLKALFPEFVKALQMADKAVVTDVYTRRELGINTPTGKDLALAIGSPKGTFIGGDLQSIANFVERNAQKNDVIILMGAGDIYKVTELLTKNV
jgi:UDP-N-acetylmuramate--alanine ligase